MSFVCLWSPAWQTVADSRAPASAAPPELAASLLAFAPRVAAGERGVLWADGRGLPARALAADLLTLLRRRGVADARAGVATTPIAAELAAVQGKEGLTVVDDGTDRAFVALFPIDALDPPPRLRPLLYGIGVTTCGELAALDPESVEVRLGAEGVSLWHRARADDRRRLFAPVPPGLPHASLEWTEYVLTDPTRLLFVINALLERVCTALVSSGQGAREIAIEFALDDRTTRAQPLLASRPTANRRTWIRLARTALDRITLGAAVTGVIVRATRVTESEAKQGDLFDRGLGSARSTEDAIARLVEDQGDVVLAPDNSAHPLLDVRTTWVSSLSASAAKGVREPRPVPFVATPPQLTLQLLPAPRTITVETTVRRDHRVPARYRDATGWHEVTQAAGPDRVSGGQWDGDHAYAREYFRCVTGEGTLVWIFRNARTDEWLLHGWWD